MSDSKPSQGELRSLLSGTADRCLEYLGSLDDRPVTPSPEGIAGLSAFDVPLQDAPMAAEQVIEMLYRTATPATMAMAGPRFFGFVIGGALPVALAADWLTSTWDQNTGLYNSTPATSFLEEMALRWLVDVLGLPSGCAGAFVTGTTVAHITALSAARHVVLDRVGWNVEADGLFHAPPVTVVVSAEAHPTLLKALGVIGFGRKRVVAVPTDGQGRMRLDALPSTVFEPTIVCAQLGNVNTGACDPLRGICEWARERGAYVHVDGAFGLWSAAAPSRRFLADGIELADSWATDGHKWLNVPYDSGIAFVRDGDALRAAMSVSAEYLPTESAHRNPSDYTPELSRRGRGVAIWAAMRSLGKSGIAELVERNCRQARDFAAGLAAQGHTIHNDVVMNQVLVSFGGPERTRKVIAALQAEGTLWAGETVWHGHVAMRISVSSWATTDADVQKSLAAIERVAGRSTA